MLTTESYTIDGTLEDLDEQISALEDAMDDLDSSTEQHKALQQRRDRLRYFTDGLVWMRDEEGWGGDAEIELGAMNAGERAKMHREAPDNAESEEMRLWFVAASTTNAPYAGDDLTETFHGLVDCHPAFVEWLEAKANSLGIPSDTGNRSARSSSATEG